MGLSLGSFVALGNLGEERLRAFLFGTGRKKFSH